MVSLHFLRRTRTRRIDTVLSPLTNDPASRLQHPSGQRRDRSVVSPAGGPGSFPEPPTPSALRPPLAPAVIRLPATHNRRNPDPAAGEFPPPGRRGYGRPRRRRKKPAGPPPSR